jgi:hypothetical protein
MRMKVPKTSPINSPIKLLDFILYFSLCGKGENYGYV